jgi:putative hydrolase of the HAD superfamily
MKIVFDFGGVLFNWHPPALLQREIPHVAHDEASARRWVAAIFQGYDGDWGQFDRGLVEVDELVLRIAARTGLAEADVLRVVRGVPRELQPIEATVQWLARLRDAGKALYFLSNMPAPYADHLEAEHAFVGWFRSGVFSARVGLAKPDPAIFRAAAQQFGQPPAEMVFIDDHLPNIESARALGWNALHFESAAQAEAAMRGRGWL